MGIKKQKSLSKKLINKEQMQAISSNNNSDLTDVYNGEQLSRQDRSNRVDVFIKNRQQRSSYLSDHEDEDEDQQDQRDMEELLNTNASEKGSDSQCSESEEEDKCVELAPVFVTACQDAQSASTASTFSDSGLIKRLKKDKVLHFKASDVFDQTETALHYAQISLGYANFKADKVMDKCDKTIQNIEAQQSRKSEILSSSRMIEEQLRRMSHM